MNWLLVEPSEGLHLSAETDGVRLHGEGIDTSDPQELRIHIPKTRLGRLLPTLVPQLLELELAVVEHGALRIPYADFVNLETCGIDAFEGIVLWAPYTLEIESSGSLGTEYFRYRYRYYLGPRSSTPSGWVASSEAQQPPIVLTPRPSRLSRPSIALTPCRPRPGRDRLPSFVSRR